ncbi:hypothetical protein [uncultured Cellulomonas sp.]|nr:hypothetical protein [uncultured Cellulomonas sp.]
MVFTGFQHPDPSGIAGPDLDPLFGLAAAIVVALVSVVLVRKRRHLD